MHAVFNAMKRVVMIVAIAIVYYFTVFKILYSTFQNNLFVFLFANLIAFAFIYQWFKGQLYQL